MTISIALTEEQRGLLQIALEIARDKFKEHAKSLLVNSANVRLAVQFDKQADEAEKLLTWITNAENVIIEEARD
jgi:hypothetical protein